MINVYLTEDVMDTSKLILRPEEVLQVSWYSKNEILKLIKEEKIARGYAYILKSKCNVYLKF